MFVHGERWPRIAEVMASRGNVIAPLRAALRDQS